MNLLLYLGDRYYSGVGRVGRLHLHGSEKKNKVLLRRLQSKLKMCWRDALEATKLHKKVYGGRQMRAVIKYEGSAWKKVSSGLPQVVVFAPIMFLIYVNNMPRLNSYTVHLFAGDVTVIKNM